MLEELREVAGVLVEAADEDLSRAAFAAWLQYGKGRHPAGLNFGDCYAYALAQRAAEPLLYKGHDFSQTDIESALPASH